jgi:Replication protein A OB domain
VKPAVGLEVPVLSRNFAPLATVSELSLGTTLDIIGVVTDVSDLYTTTPYENDREVKGRRITLTDESNGKVVNIQRIQRFLKKM